MPENELGRRHNHQEVRLGFENRQHQLDGVELPAILLNASPRCPPRMPNQRKSSYTGGPTVHFTFWHVLVSKVAEINVAGPGRLTVKIYMFWIRARTIL